MQTTALEDVLKTVKVAVVARVCGLTPKAVYKWIERGSLPRTEFTGETDYAALIANASGGKYTATEIRSTGKKQAA